MTDKELKKLKDNLWHAADVLRAGAHLAANKYGQPILGLIFLRYADILFKRHTAEINAEFEKYKGTRMEKSLKEIAIEKCGFFLPECAYYDFINNAPDDAKKAVLVKKAMEAIEKENPKLEGVLPKEVYGGLVPEEEPELLSKIVRIFKDIPENSTLDIFGEIYEYFLGNFALAEGKDGGTFYTPATVVRYMVEVLNPEPGDKKFLDPACGSGGMFVQTGDFVEQAGMLANNTMTFYGQEKVEYNAQLCLMNLAVHGLTGVIKSGDEANTFYHDAHNLNGCCDFVMANPPFNVDKVKAESAQSAGRLPFGMPAVNKNKEVSNANYLWISYFYSYLNEHGRAGFVMASSATDSQGKDKDIRQQLVQTGHVDVMVSVGNNFFYTKSLPCSLWFFDKSKREELLDKVLFIDARNYYTVVDRTLNEWSEWQLKNLNAIVWLYRGNTDKYHALMDEYAETLGGRDFAAVLSQLEEQKTQLAAEAKEAAAAAPRKEKKSIEASYAQKTEELDKSIQTAREAVWLHEKFGDGTYADIPGLCKVATRAEIEAKGYSLTPGAYVGVAPTEDDGVDFYERMTEIHKELLSLQAESNRLMETISKNWEELGL